MIVIAILHLKLRLHLRFILIQRYPFNFPGELPLFELFADEGHDYPLLCIGMKPMFVHDDFYYRLIINFNLSYMIRNLMQYKSSYSPKQSGLDIEFITIDLNLQSIWYPNVDWCKCRVVVDLNGVKLEVILKSPFVYINFFNHSYNNNTPLLLPGL